VGGRFVTTAAAAGRRVHVRAGKINAFDVGDVQPDGYHDVASVYQAVSAYEDVWRGSRTTSRSR
jgi:4-diphosphocytidyl-2-C-methyl-D-erythritol kinase